MSKLIIPDTLRISEFNQKLVEALKEKFGDKFRVECRTSQICLVQHGVHFGTIRRPVSREGYVILPKIDKQLSTLPADVKKGLIERSEGTYAKADTVKDMVCVLQVHLMDR